MKARMALACLALALSACGKRAPASDARALETAEAAPGWMHGTGYVEPAGEVRRLSFLHPGIVEEVLVEIGGDVAAGEVLMRQRNAEECAALAEAEAALTAARAEYAQTLAGVNPERVRALEAARKASAAATEHARTERERFSRLAGKGAISGSDRDRTERDFLMAESSLRQVEAELENLRRYVRAEDVAVAENKIKLAEARMGMANARLAESDLRAPCAGQVLEVLRCEGEATSNLMPEPALIFWRCRHAASAGGDCGKLRA